MSRRYIARCPKTGELFCNETIDGPIERPKQVVRGQIQIGNTIVDTERIERNQLRARVWETIDSEIAKGTTFDRMLCNGRRPLMMTEMYWLTDWMNHSDSFAIITFMQRLQEWLDHVDGTSSESELQSTCATGGQTAIEAS